MEQFKTPITKPQVPAAIWLVDRMAEEGVPAEDLRVDGRRLYLPLDPDMIRMAYHLLTYQYRELWHEAKRTGSQHELPFKTVTASSLATNIFMAARDTGKFEYTIEDKRELEGRASEFVKKGASVTALARIRGILEDEADRIGPALHEDLKRAFRRAAEASRDNLLRMAKDHPDRKGRVSGWSRDMYELLRYVHYDDEAGRKSGIPGAWNMNWEVIRKHPEFLSPNYHRADQRAKEAYESAHQSFIRKNLDKFASILGERQDLEEFGVEMKLHGGLFTGDLVMKLSNAQVHGELSLKYVVRTTPRVTPYFQYPLNFTSAVVDGEEYRRPSEHELQKLLRQEKA